MFWARKDTKCTPWGAYRDICEYGNQTKSRLLELSDPHIVTKPSLHTGNCDDINAKQCETVMPGGPVTIDVNYHWETKPSSDPICGKSK